MMNDARSRLERLAYVLWMALTAVSIGALGLTLWMPWPEPGLQTLLWSFTGVIASWTLNRLGRAHLHFVEHEASLDSITAAGGRTGGPEYNARAVSLRRVFEQWDELDGLRARGQGDVWQVLKLRREAESLLTADPQLRSEFDREMARHPELRSR